MPSYKKHIQIASLNERFLATFQPSSPSQFLCWAAVVIFYEALHYFEAYFAVSKHGRKGYTNHKKRWNRIQREPNLKSIAKAYSKLYKECNAARYYGKSFKPSDINSLRNRELSQIKSELKRLNVI